MTPNHTETTATAKPAANARHCPECGGVVSQVRTKSLRVFCSNECKQIHANRRTARGKALAAVAMGWRQTRGSGDLGKFLFAEMTSMLDAWNAEDLKAGRMRADHYAAAVTDFNAAHPQWSRRYIDRKAAK